METKLILNLKVVDVREIEGRKSPNMERVVLNVVSMSFCYKGVVTAGHLEISALMSRFD
jgi:hypothetical protein